MVQMFEDFVNQLANIRANDASDISEETTPLHVVVFRLPIYNSEFHFFSYTTLPSTIV